MTSLVALLLGGCSVTMDVPTSNHSSVYQAGALHSLPDALAQALVKWGPHAGGQEVATAIAQANSPNAVPRLAGEVTLRSQLSVTPTMASASNSLQPKLLKQINALTTKEEILSYVERCHHLLDSINLVTCLYRLARIYSFTQAAEQKANWMNELLESPSFSLLLSVIHNHLTQAQAILCTQHEVPGLNARCISNLVWSIVKLEMTAVEGAHTVHNIAVEVVLTSAPLVMRFLPDCSGQGLSNLLWSYAKVPTSPPEVMTAIVGRMVQLLERPVSSNALDAQALSNSIWAIAHVRSRPNELDDHQDWQEAVTKFLLLLANQCLNMLSTPVDMANQAQARPGSSSGESQDGRFSCQAVVNIAWSFSTILGSACGVQEPVRQLFLLIRQLIVARLQAILAGIPSAQQPRTSVLTGSFNEQALSNVVYAFDKAQLLSSDLLQAVFDMASLRLSRASTGSQGPLGFKPQELCTLLRACHLNIAQPWSFLQALNRLMAQYPSATAAWTPAEIVELHRALQLVRSGVPAQTQVLLNPRARMPFTHNAAVRLLNGNSPRGLNLPVGSLTSNAAQQLVGLDGLHGQQMLGMPSQMQAQQGASLQQVWMVDAAGNLQATTILVQPNGMPAGMPNGLPNGMPIGMPSLMPNGLQGMHLTAHEAGPGFHQGLGQYMP